MKFLDDMRERPEDERLAIAGIGAAVVALVLFLIWGIVFFRGERNTARIDIGEQTASVSEGLQDVQETLSGAVDEFSVQYRQLRRALDAAGVTQEASGTPAVNLSVDENGAVRVENIIVPANE